MMVLSYKHNFIYFKAHKVAGSSMEYALNKISDAKDVVTLRESSPLSSFAPLSAQAREVLDKTKARQGITEENVFWEHIPPQVVLAVIGEEMWNKMLKWVIVRNPFDRIISNFFHFISTCKQPKNLKKEFRKWLLKERRASDTGDEFYFHTKDLRPLKNPDGSYQKLLDFYVRYEHFEEDLTELSHRLNLPENLWDDFKNRKANADFRPASFTTQACFAGFPEGIAYIEKFAEPILKTFGYESPKA